MADDNKPTQDLEYPLDPRSQPNVSGEQLKNTLQDAADQFVVAKPNKAGDDSIQSTGSPIDYMAAAASAPIASGINRVLSSPLVNNEFGMVSSDLLAAARQLAAENPEIKTIQEALSRLGYGNSVPTSFQGGLTNNASMYQQGPSGFTRIQSSSLGIPQFADGGEVQPEATDNQVPIYDISGAKPVLGSIDHSEVQDALLSGKYSLPKGFQVPVVNPNGEHGTLDAAEAPEAFKNGYQYATPEMIDTHKYGEDTGQETKAALEGAGRGVAGPLFTAAEKALGVKDEDILKRQKYNPGLAGLGEGAGLVGGMFTGVGEAALAEKAGVLGAKALGLGEAATSLSKIGSAATKGLIENAIIASGDEASKMVLNDPEQSSQTALVNIGLSGLIGGGFGAAIGSAVPLWEATAGPKVSGVLNSIKNRVGGIDGGANDVINEAITASGMQVAPEIRAALSGDPLLRQSGQILNDAATHSGIQYQEALKGFKRDLGDKMLEALGKSRDDVAALDNLNRHDIGEKIKSIIKDDIKTRYEPIAKDYDYISNKFKEVAIPQETFNTLSDDIGALVANGGSPESAENKLIQRVLKEMPGLTNLEHLRNYTSALGRETSGIAKQELWDIGGKLRNVLNKAEESALNTVVSKEAPELLEKHMATNAAYKELKNTIGELNDRLNVGPHRGPKSFLQALDGKDGEAILAKLNPANKASIIQELSANFPKVAELVKDFHLSNVLKTASKSVQPGESVNPGRLLKELSGLSPQMRDFLVPADAAPKLQGLDALLKGLPEKIGKSGTPQGIDGLHSYLAPTSMGLAAMLLGHNPAIGALVAGVTKALGRDVPDAARLGLLKFLGSNKEISPGAFKSTVDFIHATLKGDNLIKKATSNVFKAGREVLPQALLPSGNDTDKLDKHLQSLKTNPEKLLNVGGNTTHYMPEHGQAMGATAANAVNYLNSLRPSQDRASPLDSKPIVNVAARAEYNRALSIAQQPLIVMDKIQKGTITPQDIVSLKTMYPALYTKFTNQLVSNMTESINKGEPIPYKTRLGLSMFLNQPLDSTMTPQGIMNAQPQPTQQANNPGNGPSRPPAASSVKGIGKLPATYQTPGQAREAERAAGK